MPPELNLDFDDVPFSVTYRLGERPKLHANQRELTGTERQAHRSRYSRSKAPAGFGGAVRRRNKRSGL